MYKNDYYTEEQMTKYELQTNINKTWLHTLQFFTELLPNTRPKETTVQPTEVSSVQRT